MSKRTLQQDIKRLRDQIHKEELYLSQVEVRMVETQVESELPILKSEMGFSRIIIDLFKAELAEKVNMLYSNNQMDEIDKSI